MASKEKRLARKVALVYATLAGLWILLSNQFVSQYVATPRLRLLFSDGKGLAFVVVTGVLLYKALSHLMGKWAAEMEERRQADLAQYEGEKLYRQLFEVETDALFLVDCQSQQILDVNPAAEKMYGYNRTEFLQLKAADISTEPQKTILAIENDVDFIPVCLHRRKDGTSLVVEVAASVFEFKGRKVRVAAMRDVTGRKKVEAAWVQSEERYRSLFEHMNEGVAHCRMIFHEGEPVDFVYLAVNEKFTVLTGLKDVAGRRVSELIPSLRQKDPDLFALYGRVAITARPEKTERFVAALQMWFYISVYSPGPGHFVAVFDVITERKKMEAALRDERDFSAGIIENAPAIICGIKPDGTTTFINPAGQRITGYGADEIIGKNWWQTLYPGREHGQVEQLFEHLKTGEVCDYEMTITTRTGEKRTLAWTSIRRRNQAGEVYEMVGFGNDVTERKVQQRQLVLQSSALSAAANAIVITDARGRIEWVNPSFTRLTGYDSAEVVGRNPRILNAGEQSQEFFSHMWETILKGEVWHGELTNRRRDGTTYQENMTITPVRDEAGQIAHFIAIKLDITERRQIDLRLRQAEKMEAIGTLAGGIAHDFNNILAAMFGYAYLLQQEVAGHAAAVESAGEILKAANRARDLVQQILTFSRQREQKRQPLQLGPVVKEAVKFLRASLPAGIKMDVEVGANVPLALADPTQIYQVVLNLATNSLHAMEGQKGCLTVQLTVFKPEADFLRAHPEFGPAEYVRLTMADTGHGMDAAVLGRIFEPFFTTKPVGKGTGLGLAVVHGIIKSHEGFVLVESQPGQGTTFRLYFPVQADASQPLLVSLKGAPAGDGQTILVVDDEETLTRVFRHLLRRLNYQVVICNHPREAIGLFRDNPAQFDLVITDLTMPDLNGIEVARQLRAVRQDIPVILASGTNLDMNEADLSAAGICEIIAKPVSATHLAQAVRRAVNGRPG